MSIKSKVRVKKGAKVGLRRLDEINAKALKEPKIEVGLPKGSNAYPDGTSVILVGAVHEFGSPSRNVPERSFLRSTVKSNRRKYRGIIGKIGKRTLLGEVDPSIEFRKLGLLVETDVKDKIRDIKTPPLKSRVGNPLVDTGHLIQSITHVVTE